MLYAASALFAALALAGAVSDIARRTIPNLLSLALLVSGLVWALVAGGVDTLVNHGIHVLITLAVSMVLFAIRAWGGGDAKFYPAVAAWVPLHLASTLAVSTALIGGALVLVYVLMRWFSKQRAERPLTLPYGVAIASGGLFVQAQMLFA